MIYLTTINYNFCGYFNLFFFTFAVTKDCPKCTHGKEAFMLKKRGFYVKEKGLLSLTKEFFYMLT